MQSKFIAQAQSKRLTCSLTSLLLLLIWFVIGVNAAQDSAANDPSTLAAQIEKQRQRLSSTDEEERRDAVMRLGALRQPAASKAAASALADLSVSVRVAAMTAIRWLPADESAALLIPQLNEKDPFVRQEAAYALGKSGSRTAVDPLTTLLPTEKDSGVRAAVVVSLGMIGDEKATVSLAQLLAPELTAAVSKKKKKDNQENEFVLRAAAHSLGEIRSRSGVPALLAAVQNEAFAIDIRREAAGALGLIGAPEAVSVLRGLLTSPDPYLAAAAHESLRKLSAP